MKKVKKNRKFANTANADRKQSRKQKKYIHLKQEERDRIEALWNLEVL